MSLLDYDGAAPEEQEDYNDFSNPLNVLRAPSWINSAPEKRAGLIDRAMTAFLGKLETKKDKTIKFTRPDGQEVDAPVWGADGTLTKQGEEYVSKARSLFQTAAQDPDGGLYRDEYTGRIETSPWLDNVINGKPEKQIDPLPDYQPWLKEAHSIVKEGESPKLSWDEYVKYANIDVQSEEAKIDVDDKRLKSEWAKRTALSTFSPDQMDEGEIGRVVGGQMVINPDHYSEIDKVEAWIAGQEKFSASEKKLNLLEYRKKIEQNAGELVNQFSAVDAGVLMSIGSSPLRDEFMEAASKPGFSAYQFLKDNKERFSKDSYGIGSEVATKFRDAIMATGTGALFLAGKAADAVGADGVRDVLSAPAEAWGGLAEDSAAGFSNGEAFSIGGIEVTRRDLTELTGQVGSFIAMGGIGALTGKGLLKASTSGAASAAAAGAPVGVGTRLAAWGSRYAPQGEGYILKSTLEAARVAEEAGTKGFGSKLLGWLKDAATDPELYLGSLQAAGMSHGRTYNEVLERTGSREQALKEADIQGMSDGLSAFIATGVMNRVAPGMGKALGMGDGAVGGGFVQNIRNRTLSRDGMKVVQENLEKLAGPGSVELRKQFSKDLTHAMTTSAKQLGLRGIGVVGNMGAEAVEEASDEIISDVLTSMMDDSKTWNETVWQNIGEKWQQYVKAGILGAIGGAMGDVSGALMNPGQAFGKSEGFKVQEAMWKQLKDRTAKFDSLDQYASTVSPNVTMAEYLASEVSSKGEKITIEEKSQALLAMARSGFHANFEAAVYSKEPDIAQGATGLDMDEDVTDGGATSSTATANAGTDNQQESESPFAATMAKTGVQLATNHRWKESVSLSEDKRTHELGDGLKLRLLYANDGATGATGLVGAKAVKADGIEESLSPEQALGMVPDKMKHHKLRKALAGINPEAINAQFSEQAPDEQTEKQSTGSDGNSGQKPAASKAGSGDTGASEGDGNRPATGDVPPVTPRQPEAPLSGQGVKGTPSGNPDFDRAFPQESVEFDEKSHSYFVNGEQLPSVTEKKGQNPLFSFDENEAAEAASRGRNPRYRGFSPEEIKQMWKSDSEKGSAIHKKVNDAILNPEKEHDPEIAEIAKAVRDVADGTIVSEKMIWMKGAAGTVDMLVKTKKGKWVLVDFKSMGYNPHTTPSKHKSKTLQFEEIYDGPGSTSESKAESYRVQLAAYSTALKARGIEVESHLIIPINRETGRVFKNEQGRVTISANPSKKTMDYVAEIFGDQSPAVSDTAPPQTTQPDEKDQRQGQGRQEGLLTEQESRAAIRVRNVGGIAVGAPAVTSTSKGQSHVFEKDAEGNETGVYVDRKGNVGVTEEAFKRILAENKGNAKPTMEAIQAKGEAVKAASEGFLDAKTIEEVPEVDSMLNQETSYVVSMENIDNGNVDKAGGKWRRYRQGETEAEKEASEMLGQNETYIYTPPKNSGVSLEVGDVVLIAGENDSVLVLDSVSNGELVFRKVAIAGDSLRVMSSKQKQRSFQWSTTKLLAGALKARPLLTKLQSGTVTPSEIKELFMEMVNLVAPGFKGQIVETKLDGESYLNADLGKGTINVDYAKLAANFKNLIQNANLSNDIANETIALDVARVMAKLIDEEVVHILTSKVVSKKEAVSFYKQIWEKGQDSPFFDMLIQTARERYPNLSPDPYGDNADQRDSVADDANAVYNISMELIRKLHQLSTTGATSESATSDSFVMQAAIARDLKGEGNKVSKFLNMVREMVRRYTNRVRNILWMRWQQGRLPVEQQNLLARLNAEYRREQIQGDIDNAQQATEQRAVMMATDADESFKEWVNEKARANYEVLNELRALPERFTNIQLEQMLVVDTQTMTLTLNPPIRELIEKYNLLDLAALENALADLNTETSDGQEKFYDISSYRQAMTVAFLKRQVMEAKLAALDFDMTAMIEEITGPIRGKDSAGKEYDGTMGKIQRSILDSAPVNRKAEAALRMLRMAEDETRRLERQIDFIKNVSIARETAAYMAIDPTTMAGRVELINLIKKHPEYGMSLPRVTGEMSIDEVNGYFRALKDGFTRQAKLNAYRSLQMVPVDGKPLAEVDKVYGAGEYATLSELRQKLALNRRNAAALDTLAKEAADAVAAGKLTPGDFREVAVADSRFQRFIEFRDAAEDYDQYLKNIVSRSLGDFFVNNKEFGVVFTDLSQREGSGAQMKFPEYRNDLPEAGTAGEVFGADFKQKGERIAHLPERHYEKDGQPLTAQQIAENEERDLIDRMAKSNAAFAGRQHFNRAFLDYHLGNVGLDEDYDRYMETGGFKLNIKTDPETGRVFIESPQAAFRTLNMTEIRAIRKGLKASSRTSGASLAELIETIERVRNWARKINDSVGPGMTVTIGGRQTLAARAKLMIDDQFGNKRNLRFVDRDGNVVMDELKGFSFKEINGLYPLINQLHENLINAINPYVTIAEKDGRLVITPKTTDGIKQATTAASERLWAQDGKDAFTRMDSANETVKLVRTSLKEFKDRQWRQNYEREASKTQRQGMYDEGDRTPDNPELLELLESPIDTRLFSNGLWLTKFHEELRDYSVSGNFAYEAMAEYAAANYGEGVMPDGERDPNSVAFDRRVNIGTMGEKSEDFIGLTGDLLPGSSLTAAESAINRAASGENSRRFWVTKWGLVIGATSDGLFSADEAKRFVFDMVNMEKDGGSMIERMNLLKRGIRGLFPIASSFSEKNQKMFFEGALEQFLAANTGYIQGPDFSSEYPKLSKDVALNGEEMSDFVAKKTDNRFSAEQMLVDLLEFKAGFERDVLLEARVGDQLGAAINAVSMSLPSEETVDIEEEVDEVTEEPNPEFQKFLGSASDSPYGAGKAPPKTIKKTTKVKKIKKLKKSQLSKSSIASPDETLRIRDGLRLMVTENDVPLYDASLMAGGIDGIGNPFLSLLAQNLTGKTLVFSPTEKQVTRLGLQDVWMKVFPGRDGVPNLIYAPQGQASPEVSSQVAHGAIAQMLTIASQNPDVKIEIDRLGSTIAKALDPVMMVQSIQDELAKGKAKWLTPRISRKLSYSERRNSLRSGINEDNILNQFANEQNEQEADREIRIGAVVTTSDVYKSLEPTLDDLSPSEKKQFRADLAAHLLKMSELSRELGITNQTTASMSLFPQRTAHLFWKDNSPQTVEFSERKTTSNILLIAEVLTNPSAKKFLDESYKGPDMAENTRLSDAIEQALHSAIVAVRRTQGDEGVFNEDYTDGSLPNSNELSNREDDEIEDTEEPSNANETTPDSPELEALMRSERGDDAIEEQVDEDAVENERYRREDKILDATTNSAADMLLFNGLARILEFGKLANGFDYEGSPEQRRTYNVLAKPAFTDLSKKAKTGPLFSKNMTKASPSMIYAGEMRHLTLPKANGHTMHNLAFSARRTSNASAAVVLRAGDVRNIVNEVAQGYVQQTLRENPGAEAFPRIDVRVPVTDNLISEISMLLPSGQFEQELAAARAMLDGLDTKEENLLERRSKALEALYELGNEIGNTQQERKANTKARLEYEIKSLESEIRSYTTKLAAVPSETGGRGEYQDDQHLEFLTGQLEATREALVQLDAVPEGSLEYADYESAELRRQVRDLAVAHVVNHAALLEQGVIDAANMGQTLATTLREAMANDSDLRGHANSLFDLLNQIRSNFAMHGKAALAEEGQSEIAPEGTSAVFARKIGLLMKAYNFHASILNSHIDYHARRGMALAGLNGATANTRAFKVGKFDLGEGSVVTSRLLGKMRGDLRGMLDAGPSAEAYFDLLVNNVARSVTMESPRGENRNARKANDFLRDIARDYIATPGMTETELRGLVEQKIAKALDEQFASGLKTAMDEIALSVGEARALMDAKVMTPMQLERMKQAEIILNHTRDQLRQTRKELDRIDNNDGEQYLGLGYYQGEFGAPPVYDKANRVKTAAVPMGQRKFGVNLFLVAPEMEFQKQYGESDEDVQAKAEAVRAGWVNQTGTIDAATQAENNRRTQLRRDHWVRNRALTKALNDVVRDYIEGSYAKARGTEENFVGFDPLKVINEAVDFSMAEREAMDNFFQGAAHEAGKAANAGLSASAVALLTDPADGAYEALSAPEKGKVRMLRMPENHRERKEKIGRLFEMDGEAIILMPTGAKERLMRAFPKTITKRNVASELEGTVLDALDIGRQSRESIRHAELEAKHNAGTISEYEKDEARKIVEKRARESKGIIEAVHGGVSGIESFDAEKIKTQDGGAGFYFSTAVNSGHAENYAKKIDGKVYRVFLRLLRPYYSPTPYTSTPSNDKNVWKPTLESIRNLYGMTDKEVALFVDHFDGLTLNVLANPHEFSYRLSTLESRDVFADFSSKVQAGIVTMRKTLQGKYGAQTKLDLIGFLTKHDGIIYKDGDVATVLHPSQIKSAEPFTGVPLDQRFNSQSDSILNALPLNPQPNLQAALNPDYSYFLNGTKKEEPKAFDDFASFSLTNSGPLTKGEAAKLFRARFVDSAKKMMRLAANNGVLGAKEPKMDGDVTQASLNQFGYMLERLVIAHGDKNLSRETRKEVSDLLQRIDRGVINQPGDGSFGVNENGIKAVRIHQTFSKVFSEIEAAAIQKRLIAGLSLTGRGREIELGILKYLHHQDARIRHRFIKNHAARQAAHHLNAFLDYGVDGKSGRRGYTTSKKAAEEAIGKKAEDVGTDALNHTIGYLVSVFRGMDNAFGLNKVQAFKQVTNDMNLGFYQLLEFDKAQNAYYRNSFTKYWNGHSLDLMRDKELAQKIIKVLNGINMKSMPIQTEADVDIIVEKIIAALEAEVTDGKLDEVRAYSDAITDKMTDIHNAMLFTTAMLSQDAADVEETQMLDWRDRSRPVFRETSTSVPLRLSYASNPDPEFLGKESEGRYISDPADLVSFKDASFFGGVGRNEVIGKDQPVFRPIAINGLTSPLSMMDDALYRLNITPTYETLRRAYGRATTDHGIPTVKDGHFLEKIAGMAPNDKDYGGRTRDYKKALAEHDDRYFEFQKALAGVASELEVVLQNDSQINVMNTGGAEVMRFLGSAYIFRALASPLQLWDQTASPSIGYAAGKLVTGRPRMAASYFKIMGRIMTDSEFRRQVKGFIKRVEPMVFYRSADGQDVARDVMGSQVRYGRAKVKNAVGKGLRKYENYGEKALMLTIGSGERVIAASVFLTELMEQMGGSSLERLLKLDADAIPMTVKNDARIKVNDLMSQSDQSKKSWMFQTRTSSPARNALFRSLVRFSNHTAGVASNVSAMSGAAVSPLMSKIDGRKFGGYDKQSQQEALDVVVTTLTQNVLFYPMKLKMMVPILAYLAFMLGGDDDDEATKKAQELADTLLAPTDDGSWLGNFIKGLVFGKRRELFQSNKTPDAAQSSALAEVMTKTLLESFQLIPVAGAAAGFAPVSGALQRIVTNPMSESATSILTGVEKATGPYSKKATTIRSYEKNWDENLVSATAPTQMVYDLASALKLSVDYNLTREASTNRPSALINTAAYLVAEGLPFGREPRSAMKGVLQKPVWDEEKRNR